ncbi:phage holin [Mediterraneibacter sp. NSJ-55]|uniref:Phage holin n=1 Tax=Mediterraneibacter hominis TaxID=2763054 RepID=A0A923RRB2_9FIRM|nr:phage holin [Mediterraneibacter hominis]MBC5688217.1 phage holin [Mediterraneibacter hominis]
MKNINLKGLTKENVIGVVVLLVALINAILQIFGIQTLPVTNDEVSNIISTIFLIATTAYGVYNNFNVSKPSQIAQQITDGIKDGELLVEQVEDMIEKLKNTYKDTEHTEG